MNLTNPDSLMENAAARFDRHNWSLLGSPRSVPSNLWSFDQILQANIFLGFKKSMLREAHATLAKLTAEVQDLENEIRLALTYKARHFTKDQIVICAKQAQTRRRLRFARPDELDRMGQELEKKLLRAKGL